MGTIERPQACSSDADGEQGQDQDEYLIVNVNGGSGLLLSFGCDSRQLRASSTGWIDGNRSFVGRPTSTGGLLVEFDYRSYLIAGAAREGPDEMEVSLEADDSYLVRLERIEVGRDVHPGSTTELAVVDQRIEKLSPNPLISLDVELRSDRVDKAAVRLVNAIGVVNPGGLDPLEVEVVDGVGSGTLAFEGHEEASVVSGVLVADTNGFNSPAVEFEFDRSLAASSGSLRRGAFGFVAAALAVIAVVALRPVADSHPQLFPILAVVALLLLPAFAFVRVLADDVLADSGGTWWVMLIYLLLGVWALAFFVPALRRTLRSSDTIDRTFVVVASITALGLGAVVGAAIDNYVLAIVVLYPPIGLVASWRTHSKWPAMRKPTETQ